ncbi:N-acetylmuramoyl-L-alanine amidase (plasmid) [Paenibacillus larvae subsp. larvae]|uniref:N-acetylmuramoyl-L-alanine amidase n=1 Tax=Paenibacillus larvae subsp. larvae TaxID=147375 RepID=A0A2L1UK31_9BACL|nr:copper amine oxidase N-terminal domain-containing protein [Paenibacillus larvae]AQT86995.1 hypothetical protein B1222_23470 [Paenibacillus larvae subsp. pulvifaciens]AQZ49328.1 hypothetical protein B5S25_22775 [Paenibacillus larvae subsp. pulvifaciens]AVF28918.1 N-acetylmuramoyl-L-alanine amidase [Paenibacillus larvae subsp. larvae]AVF33300.1 N-acetylmuramoyl-L-alanine amidase [Paenibacillus larvae subsp. larvae]MCY7518883.1 copper amine oxidase N-terminal domain-containing protein [Paeniba
MKKVFLSVIAAATITVGVSAAAPAKAAPNDEDIKVKLNNQTLTFDVKPKIIDGRTYVPVAKILEEMGADVKWHEDTWTVTAEKDDVTITMPIGDSEIEVDDQKLDIGLPSKIERGRTLVPLRLVSYATGTRIEWDDEDQTVLLTQSTEELVNQFVSGKVDDPVTYEHSKVLFDWILKEDQKGHLEPFYGNRAPKVNSWTGKPYTYKPSLGKSPGSIQWSLDVMTRTGAEELTYDINREVWTGKYRIIEYMVTTDTGYTGIAYGAHDQTVHYGIFNWQCPDIISYLPINQ